jgi:parallel beta-helix repeat protein
VVNVPKDFKTIQDAVDSAALGDTILVAPGLYVENIYITKKLSLQSTDGYKSTVIQAKMPAASVITIEKVGGVLITGFTVKGSLNSGIHLRRVTDSTITGNYLTKNMMGIYLEHSSKNDIKKNISTKNAEGINLYYSFRNNIIANEAYSNSEKGIVLYTSNANRLISNEANSNVWDGITIWNSKRNHLRSNVAVGNTYAIVTDNEENDIFDNRTMRRLYYVLPIVLIYLALVLYNLEKKLFRYIYKVKPKGIGPKKWHRL